MLFGSGCHTQTEYSGIMSDILSLFTGIRSIRVPGIQLHADLHPGATRPMATSVGIVPYPVAFLPHGPATCHTHGDPRRLERGVKTLNCHGVL